MSVPSIGTIESRGTWKRVIPIVIWLIQTLAYKDFSNTQTLVINYFCRYFLSRIKMCPIRLYKLDQRKYHNVVAVFVCIFQYFLLELHTLYLYHIYTFMACSLHNLYFYYCFLQMQKKKLASHITALIVPNQQKQNRSNTIIPYKTFEKACNDAR